MGCEHSSDDENTWGNTDKPSDYVPQKKVVIIGDQSVGKSSIIHQFVFNAFGN